MKKNIMNDGTIQISAKNLGTLAMPTCLVTTYWGSGMVLLRVYSGVGSTMPRRW